jgi:hypothetical protein
VDPANQYRPVECFQRAKIRLEAKANAELPAAAGLFFPEIPISRDVPLKSLVKALVAVGKCFAI